MPNRIIKESICTSEDIDQLTPFQEIFFYRLLVNCDDYGCFDAREKVVASRLFPLRNVKPDDIIKTLNLLSELGLIILYLVDGKPYLKVVKWADHQRVRVSKHKYPVPEDGEVCDNLQQSAASCGELRRVAASCGELRPESNPIQSNPNPNMNPNTNPNSSPDRRKETDLDELFNMFWDNYPRKESKPAARKAFEKIKPDHALTEQIVESVQKWKLSPQWRENGGQFIPYPASWLNQRKWEDQVPAPAPVQHRPQRILPAQDFQQRDYSSVEDDMMASLAKEMAEAKRRGEV